MFDVKKMIDEILQNKTISNISFVGCGGSISCFKAPLSYVQHEAKVLTASVIPSNELVYDTPNCINEHSIVIVSSRKGNTPETVEAAKVAKQHGATVIGLQLVEKGDSELCKACDYIVEFNDTVRDPEAPASEGKAAYALKITYELVHALESNSAYDKMVSAMEKIDGIVTKAMYDVMPNAIKFSQDFANDEVIYTLGSGVAYAAAYQQAICIFMEVGWINSAAIHSGEFFHGPLEITSPDTAFLMLRSTGKSRPLDERVIDFLKQFNHHLHVVDGNDYGMSDLGEVSGYFDHLFYTEIMSVHEHLLADMRNHPVLKRRYMWKYNF